MLSSLEPFIERVKKGLNEKTSLLYLNQQYEKGKMNKKQLLAYKVALDDAYDQKKAEQVKKELLSQVTEKDKLKKEFWPLFEDGTCTVGTPDFNLMNFYSLLIAGLCLHTFMEIKKDKPYLWMN